MNSVFIRADRCYQKIDIASVLYVEASGNYSKVVTTGKTLLALVSLKQFDESVPKDTFCRIHRGFLVNTTLITKFDKHCVWLGELRLPLGQAYIQRFFAQMPILIQNNEKEDMPRPRPRKKFLAALAKTVAAGR